MELSGERREFLRQGAARHYPILWYAPRWGVWCGPAAWHAFAVSANDRKMRAALTALRRLQHEQ